MQVEFVRVVTQQGLPAVRPQGTGWSAQLEAVWQQQCQGASEQEVRSWTDWYERARAELEALDAAGGEAVELFSREVMSRVFYASFDSAVNTDAARVAVALRNSKVDGPPDQAAGKVDELENKALQTWEALLDVESPA